MFFRAFLLLFLAPHVLCALSADEIRSRLSRLTRIDTDRPPLGIPHPPLTRGLSPSKPVRSAKSHVNKKSNNDDVPGFLTESKCANGDYCADGNACCESICVDPGVEICCPDKVKGPIACAKEVTQCCAPQDGLPSRCCPRYAVCCATSRYGCCFPDRLGSGSIPIEKGFAFLEHAAYSKYSSQSSSPSSSSASTSSASSADLLMTMSNLSEDSPLVGLSIDLTSGKRAGDAKVTGFNDWNEDTRMFTYNRARRVFYLPQANFTGRDPIPDSKREIHLYTVNPATGDSKSCLVTGGPTGLVTGFAYDNVKERLVIATRIYSDASRAAISIADIGNSTANLGYHFWETDVDSCASTLISTRTFGAGESEDYSGYFKRIISVGDKSFVMRIGNEDVLHGLYPGAGFTDITSSTAGSTFVRVDPSDFKYQPFASANPISSDHTRFASVASTNEGLSNDFALFEWSVVVGTGTANVTLSQGSLKEITKMGNLRSTPVFGPIGCSVAEDFSSIAVLAIHNSIDSRFDLWALGTYEFASKKQETKVVDPWMLADTNALSGFEIR